MLLSPKLATVPPLSPKNAVLFPVIVDRVTRMTALSNTAHNPYPARLLAMIEFRTMTLMGLHLRRRDDNAILVGRNHALADRDVDGLASILNLSKPSLALRSILTLSRTAVVVPVPLGKCQFLRSYLKPTCSKPKA